MVIRTMHQGVSIEEISKPSQGLFYFVLCRWHGTQLMGVTALLDPLGIQWSASPGAEFHSVRLPTQEQAAGRPDSLEKGKGAVTERQHRRYA